MYGQDPQTTIKTHTHMTERREGKCFHHIITFGSECFLCLCLRVPPLTNLVKRHLHNATPPEPGRFIHVSVFLFDCFTVYCFPV